MGPELQDFYVPGLMDLQPYTLIQATLDEDWDKFINSSPQGNIFSQRSFLKGTRYRLGLWYCYKGKKRAAAVVLVETEDGLSTYIAPYTIHTGIYFSGPERNQSVSQIHSEQFRITSAIIRDLDKKYKDICFSLAPEFLDLRPILWHNYNNDAPKFDIKLRYTSRLKLELYNGPIDKNPMYLCCNKSRRQEIRYALEEGIIVRKTDDYDKFIDLYAKTFMRQEITLPEKDISIVRNIIIELITGGKLVALQAELANGSVASMAAFGKDSHRAYYIFGASDPKFRKSAAGTYLLFQAFNYFAKLGVAEMDLEGINSPKRGYFKLSFGGNILPYYQVELRKGLCPT